MSVLRHCGIVVADIERAIEFYCNVLGLKEAPAVQEKGPFLDGLLGFEEAEIRTAKLGGDNGSSLLELLEFKSPQPIEREVTLNSLGPTHIALTVDNLDALYKTLTEDGIVFNAPPAVSDNGMAKVAFCRDPEGNYIELVEEL